MHCCNTDRECPFPLHLIQCNCRQSMGSCKPLQMPSRCDDLMSLCPHELLSRWAGQGSCGWDQAATGTAITGRNHEKFAMAHFWFFSPFKAPGFFLLCMPLMFKLSKAQDISHLNILMCRDKFTALALEITSKVTAWIWEIFWWYWRFWFFLKQFSDPQNMLLLLNAIFTWTKGFCFILESISRLLYGNLSKSLVILLEMTVTFSPLGSRAGRSAAAGEQEPLQNKQGSHRAAASSRSPAH